MINYDGTQNVRYAQQKLDGFYVEVYRGAAKSPCIAQLKTTQLPVGLPVFDNLPEHSHICGELWHEGPATSLPTLLKDPSQWHRLRFSAFAIRQWRGKTFSITGSVWDINTILCKQFETPVTFNVANMDIEALLAIVKAHHWEGVVLKYSNLSGWYKLKPVKTVDAIVMDYSISGSDSYFGKLKSFTFGCYAGGRVQAIASVGTGFTKEFKLQCNPSEFIGRVAEIEYQAVAARGRLQFPRFLRWRVDKSAITCKMEQII